MKKGRFFGWYTPSPLHSEASIDGKVWKVPARSDPPTVTVDDLRRVLIAKRRLEHELSAEPSCDALHDPLLLKNLGVAAERITSAIESGERVTIVGDYDVDGLCGTTILVENICARWPQAREQLSWIIPDRFLDGYGLRQELLPRIMQTQASLVITIDNGSGDAADAAISDLRKQGVDTIVLDHHLTHTLPDAIVVNPHQPECQYPNKDLCGSGVAWKVAQVLRGEAPPLGLLALATVADVVKLRLENRMLVQLGLEEMRAHPHPALRSLCIARRQRWEAATSEMLAYWIAPIINASHRIPRDRNVQNPAEALMLHDDPGAANDLLQLFMIRRNLQDRAQTTIRKTIHHQREKSIVVLTGDDFEVFHEGLVGLFAAEVVEKTGKPCAAVTQSGKGSARSIDAYHITHALQRQADTLHALGGHHHAAGFTVKKNCFPAFRERLFRDAEQLLQHERLEPGLDIDAVIEADAMRCIMEGHREALKSLLRDLGPFGRENEAPKILIPNVQVLGVDCVGALDRHVRLETSLGRMMGYFFGRPNPSIEHLKHDLVVTPSEGSEGIMLLLRSLRLPSTVHWHSSFPL